MTSIAIAKIPNMPYQIPLGFATLILSIWKIETITIPAVKTGIKILSSKGTLKRYKSGKINAVYVTGRPMYYFIAFSLSAVSILKYASLATPTSAKSM